MFQNISGRIIEATQPNPDVVSIDEKSEYLNNTTAIKDISNIKNTFIEVFKGTDLLIKEQIVNPANNSVNLNTENVCTYFIKKSYFRQIIYASPVLFHCLHKFYN